MKALAAAMLAMALAVPAFAQSTRPAPAPATTQSALVDINSASEAELDALPGVGKTRAEAIIKNRPYSGKDDLLSRHILPKNVYDGIKDKIIARRK